MCRNSKDSMPATLGPRLSTPGCVAGQELDHHLLSTAKMRAPAKVDRIRRRNGVLGKLNIVGYDPQVVFGPGLLPVAANRDLLVQSSAHQPADRRPIQVQRLVELKHGAAGRFQNDRLAAALASSRAGPS